MISRFKERDKQQHFWYSFFILLVCSVVLPVTIALAFTFCLGVLKELWDHYCGSGFCWYDMMANFLGMILAWPLVLFF